MKKQPKRQYILRKCPFCGKDTEYTRNGGLKGVHCSNPSCIGFDIVGRYSHWWQAVYNWNKRDLSFLKPAGKLSTPDEAETAYVENDTLVTQDAYLQMKYEKRMEKDWRKTGEWIRGRCSMKIKQEWIRGADKNQPMMVKYNGGGSVQFTIQRYPSLEPDWSYILCVYMDFTGNFLEFHQIDLKTQDFKQAKQQTKAEIHKIYKDLHNKLSELCKSLEEDF